MDGARFSARDRRLRHGVPVALAATLAFVIGLLLGSDPGADERRTARAYLSAWEQRDFRGMYARLDARSRRLTPFSRFAAAHRAAAETATLERLEAGEEGDLVDGRVRVPVRLRTRLFGTLRASLRLPVEETKVRWGPELAFPGLRAGERLSRRTALPPRAALLARDGRVLARGPERTSSLPELAGEIVGELGPPPAAERAALTRAGYPPDARVGTSGLERVFERDLAGRPGGRLLAGPRVLARARARRGRDVRTTIDPALERAAIASLAGRLGGTAAVDPRTGEVLALAGLAFSGLQPPGSTFKIITAAGALEARKVRMRDSFPVQTAATLEGIRLENANGESCGGTFLNSFAHSCNSVFAPLGAKLGAEELVAAAERFGFNEPLGIPGAATSTIPPAAEIGDDLAVGSSAIGQGKVQATALQMALVGATIAAGGRRPRPTLRARARPRFVRATPAPVARQVRRAMIAVVEGGTGTNAKIPGVRVAGKTGTAELADTAGPNAGASAPETDAWFVAFAPASRPRVAVGVLLVQAGAGGDVAAPAARTVLQTGLRRR